MAQTSSAHFPFLSGALLEHPLRMWRLAGVVVERRQEAFSAARPTEPKVSGSNPDGRAHKGAVTAGFLLRRGGGLSEVGPSSVRRAASRPVSAKRDQTTWHVLGLRLRVEDLAATSCSVSITLTDARTVCSGISCRELP